LPSWTTAGVCSRSVAKGNIAASGGLDDSPDRLHDDPWLVDRHDVAGVFSDDQASSLRQRRLISLQLPPMLVGSLSASDGDYRDRERAARAPDFLRAFPKVDDLVSRRPGPGCTKAGCPRKVPH
jgi:hypothetical protein